MQKKRNTKFSAIDFAIIFLCLAGSIASGLAFLGEYYRIQTKLNEDAIGTIVFKKRSAQRRFIDRLAWDRLRRTSLVYNGDMIRTIELSEAVITFRDEVTQLTLEENTIIQIFWDEIDGARIDFSGGNLGIQSGRNVTITSGDSRILVNGLASIFKGQEGYILAVQEGEASYNGSIIEQGSILSMDSNGERSTKPAIVMTSFGVSARVLSVPGTAAPVVFSWNTANFANDTRVIIEVAADRGFNNMVRTMDISDASSAIISLENGSYWWRAYPVNGGSREPANAMYPSGTLDVIPAGEAVLISPARSAEYTFVDHSLVPFSWTAVEGASEYLLEVSSNEDMSTPVVSRRVQETSVTQTGLGAGRWYWRITPVFPSWIKGSAPSSIVNDFTLVHGRPVLAEPVLTYPPQNGNIYVDAGHRLMWAHDPNVVSWQVVMADNSAMTNPIVRQDVASNYYSLPRELIQAGKTWYWRVSALGGDSPAVSVIRNFAVTAGSPPSAGPVFASAVMPEGAIRESGPAGEPEPVRAPIPAPSTAAPSPPVVLTSPVLTFPSQGGILYVDSSDRRLQWNYDSRTASWLVEVADNPAMTNPAVRQNVSTNSYNLPQNLMQAGRTWYWRVSALGGDSPAVSMVRNFVVRAADRPPDPPVVVQPPPVVIEPPPVKPGDPLARLTQISGTGTVSGTFPANGSVITTGQLQNAERMNFGWNGKASEYRFALYRADGQEIVPVSAVNGSAYTLDTLALEEGEYVWQVYEKDRRGNWGLPSTANRFTVTQGEIRTMPGRDPGELYGNR
ncbi:MAG: hypothetical protein FWG27_02525 [Treponema sp.]|nr:hypothetical protein [Treponema sp.]